MLHRHTFLHNVIWCVDYALCKNLSFYVSAKQIFGIQETSKFLKEWSCWLTVTRAGGIRNRPGPRLFLQIVDRGKYSKFKFSATEWVLIGLKHSTIAYSNIIVIVRILFTTHKKCYVPFKQFFFKRQKAVLGFMLSNYSQPVQSSKDSTIIFKIRFVLQK